MQCDVMRYTVGSYERHLRDKSTADVRTRRQENQTRRCPRAVEPDQNGPFEQTRRAGQLQITVQITEVLIFSILIYFLYSTL